MKTTDKERLLIDLIHDEGYQAFRAELFDTMAGGLRRHETRAPRYKLLALAACIPIACAVCLFLLNRTPPRVLHKSSVAVVRTVPFPPDRIVATAGIRTESSIPGGEVVVFRTPGIPIEIVRSEKGPQENLTDEQLLDLFKGHPVALVVVGPNERRLVFLNEEKRP